MRRLLYTTLFCLVVYALSLLALLAVEPIVDGARALSGSPAIVLSGRLTTQAQPVAMSAPARKTAQVAGAAPSIASAAIPTPSGAPPVFWLLPLPPDLLVTALMLRRLWRGRRTYGAAPAWRVS